MSSELHWIVGAERAAVRGRDSRVFRLWPRPSEPGRVPIGLHMALARPDDELYSDPSATRALVSHALPAPPLRSTVAWGVIGALAAVCGVTLGMAGLAGNAGWSGPAQHIGSVLDLVGALAFAALGYAAAALWEASLCTAQLREPASEPVPRLAAHEPDSVSSCFGLGSKGPTVEPVVWRMNLSVASAWQSLLAPLLWSLVLLACELPWPVVGSGFAAGSLLYLLRVCLPLRPGPASRILETLFAIPDFSTGLRWGLTTLFLPRNQRSSSGGPKPVVVAAGVTLLWLVAAGLAFPLLATSDLLASSLVASHPVASNPVASTAAVQLGGESQAALPLTVWRLLAGLAGGATFLWWVESVARLFRYALLFGGRVERRPMSPSLATTGLWQRQCALMQHVPAMSKLAWQWSEASPGTLLVRQDERDRSFHWLASGEARVVSRDAAGNVRKLATVRGGSGVGEVALLEDQPRTADVIVSVTALVISLSFEDFDRGMEKGDRERFREVVFAGRAFAASQVFEGCPGPDKERWIRGGRPRRYRAGERIITQGETERWMGLVVEGTLEVEQDGARIALLEPSSVFGEVAFLYETPRNASLIAKTQLLLWSWDADWLEEEVERTGLRPELEALAERRAR